MRVRCVALSIVISAVGCGGNDAPGAAAATSPGDAGPDADAADAAPTGADAGMDAAPEAGPSCAPGSTDAGDAGCIPVGLQACASVFVDPDGVCRPRLAKCAAGSIPKYDRGA